MADSAFQREVAEEHAKAICDDFGVPFVETQSKSDAYKERIQEKCQFCNQTALGSFLTNTHAQRFFIR